MTTVTPDEDRLLEHNYDGIQEFDNPMPRWWVWIFWATIVFSVLYLFDIRGSRSGPGRVAEYDRSRSPTRRKRWPQTSRGRRRGGARGAGEGPECARGSARPCSSTNCAPCHRRRRRRPDRTEPHRRVLAPRRRARRDPQDDHRGRAGEGDAAMGQDPQAGAGRTPSPSTSHRCTARNPPNPKARRA